MATIPRQSDTPKPGFYLLRLIRKGPWVGAQIVHDNDGWRTMVDGTWSGPSNDPWLLPDMERIHYYGRESTASEVEYRIGKARWAAIYKPDAIEANPKRPIDLDKLIPF